MPTRDLDDAATTAAALTATAASTAAEVVRVASATAKEVLLMATHEATLQNAAMRVDLQYIKDDLKEIKARLDSKFVSIEAFDPIRRLVYGVVALMLVGIVGAALALVLKQP